MPDLIISDVYHSHLVDALVSGFDPTAVTQYICTLTEDALADLVLPISSFSMTLRQSTNQNYLSVVVPQILNYTDDIILRIDGEMTITQISSGISRVLLTANISDLRTDQGARSRSGTIVAYKQITYPGTGAHTLTGASYRSYTNGVRRYRCTPHPHVQPLDSVTINEETLNVDTVTWTVSVQNQVMEITELLP